MNRCRFSTVTVFVIDVQADVMCAAQDPVQDEENAAQRTEPGHGQSAPEVGVRLVHVVVRPG